MLISAVTLKSLYPKFSSFSDEIITRKLSVIELSIRQHTNNNFQDRYVRTETDVSNGLINWDTDYLVVGDTLEISDGINKGLYTVKTVSNSIETLEHIYDYPLQLITKIRYPLDVIEGALDLLDWELIQQGKEKTSIASETISRHSVSYVGRNGDNTINGFPIELFNFCKDYMKARF